MKTSRKALRKSGFAALARLMGVFLGAGSGNLIHSLLGGGFNGWIGAAAMAVVAFALTWWSEYYRELD